MVLSDQIYAMFDAAELSAADRLHVYVVIGPHEAMDEAIVKDRFWNAYKTLIKQRSANG